MLIIKIEAKYGRDHDGGNGNLEVDENDPIPSDMEEVPHDINGCYFDQLTGKFSICDDKFSLFNGCVNDGKPCPETTTICFEGVCDVLVKAQRGTMKLLRKKQRHAGVRERVKRGMDTPLSMLIKNKMVSKL